jgi:hypothetical protein
MKTLIILGNTVFEIGPTPGALILQNDAWQTPLALIRALSVWLNREREPDERSNEAR